MLGLVKSFVFLSFLFLSGLLIGAIYTPELIVHTKSMMNDEGVKPAMNKELKVKQKKTIRLV